MIASLLYIHFLAKMYVTGCMIFTQSRFSLAAAFFSAKSLESITLRGGDIKMHKKKKAINSTCQITLRSPNLKEYSQHSHFLSYFAKSFISNNQ